MQLECFHCGWKRDVRMPGDVCACTTCKTAEHVYLVGDNPICRVCGEPTKASSGSHLGATWDCPKGHFREVLSKSEGRYYLADGQWHPVDTASGSELEAALSKLKK